jgi:uncharacterized protein (DUF1778 family)
MSTISIRVNDDDLAEIDRRADSAGMARSAFMLKTALDRATADERRLEEIEDRLAHAEERLEVLLLR